MLIIICLVCSKKFNMKKLKIIINLYTSSLQVLQEFQNMDTTPVYYISLAVWSGS